MAACACFVLSVAGAADASSVGNVATARAFVAGLNTPTRARGMRLLASVLRFRTLTNPWVRYVGSARAQFVEDGFGTNCALRIVNQSASRRLVRIEVDERRYDTHPCVGGQLGTRAVFVFGFNDSGRVATLSLQNA